MSTPSHFHLKYGLTNHLITQASTASPTQVPFFGDEALTPANSAEAEAGFSQIMKPSLSTVTMTDEYIR